MSSRFVRHSQADAWEWRENLEDIGVNLEDMFFGMCRFAYSHRRRIDNECSIEALELIKVKYDGASLVYVYFSVY